ncbi:MAG: glycosyltransferase [Muribaculum sp.]|nr:glycosyltransferase [Muribaculum sp.]
MMSDSEINIDTLPLISILIPIYNTAQYLKECIESILLQSYKNIHVVLLNDGSVDNCEDICLWYSNIDTRIEYHAQPHNGIAVSRNVLISYAKGQYSIFIDSDDRISPDMIQELYNYVKQYDLDIVSSKIDSTTDNYFKFANRQDAVETFIRTTEILPSLCTKLVRTNLYKRITIPQHLEYAEDTWVTWRLLNISNRIGLTNRAYYHYRKRHDSITHKSFKEEFINSHLIWQQIYNECKNFFPHLAQSAKRRMLLLDIYLMYWANLSNYKNMSDLRLLQDYISRNLRTLINPFNHIPLKFVIYGLISMVSHELIKKLILMTSTISPQYLKRATMKYDC